MYCRACGADISRGNTLCASCSISPSSDRSPKQAPSRSSALASANRSYGRTETFAVATAEPDPPRRPRRRNKSAAVAGAEPDPPRRSHRRSKPFVVAEPHSEPPAGKAKNKRALYMALLLVVLIIILAAAVLLKSKEKTSAASLATTTAAAAAMGLPCRLVSRPSSRHTSPSAGSDENRTRRGDVTRQSICGAPQFQITSITMAKSTSPVGEITQAQSDVSLFEPIYGSNWLKTVRANHGPRSAANRSTLADVVHSVGAAT